MNKEIDIRNVHLKLDERFYLRFWTPNDLDDLHEMLEKDGVAENLGMKQSLSLEDSLRVLKKYLRQTCNFAIVDGKKDKVIGSLGLENYTPSELLVEYKKEYGRELYGYISPLYWGNRLMSRSIECVVKYAFDDAKLDFIIAGHYQENIKSKKMIERMHFSYTNTIDYVTAYENIVPVDLYILWEKEYRKRNL